MFYISPPRSVNVLGTGCVSQAKKAAEASCKNQHLTSVGLTVLPERAVAFLPRGEHKPTLSVEYGAGHKQVPCAKLK